MHFHSLALYLMQIAKGNPNKEVCGVVDSAGMVHQITNEAKNKNICFVFNKLQYLRLLGTLMKEGKKVFCIFHSHPSGDLTPSKADIEFAQRLKYPSLIVTSDNYRWVL